jgi:hypothetical protein
MALTTIGNAKTPNASSNGANQLQKAKGEAGGTPVAIFILSSSGISSNKSIGVFFLRFETFAASSPSPCPVYLLEPKEQSVFITFKDLAGISSWGFVLTFLLVLLGFFPIAVLLGVGAIFLATLWMASQ